MILLCGAKSEMLIGSIGVDSVGNDGGEWKWKSESSVAYSKDSNKIAWGVFRAG